MDADGKLVVIELKRDRTPREVVAQLLDYGSWIRTLGDEDIAAIFEAFLKKHHPGHEGTSLDEAFCQRFSVKEMPEGSQRRPRTGSGGQRAGRQHRTHRHLPVR